MTSAPPSPLVRTPASLRGADEGVVLARETHGASAFHADEAHDFLVDLTGEDHLDDVHRRASSVMRSPETKLEPTPILSSAALICGPPPCTTTTWMPT